MAPSRRWAVLIGVNQCGRDVQLPPLRYAESDALAVKDVLLDQDIGTFDDGDVTMFVGPDATWRQIKVFLRELALQAAPSDVLFVYFAGHTLVPQWSDLPDAYLVTADLEPEVLAREPDNGLRMSFLKRDIFDAFAGASFLVLDCCHAGVYADADRRNTKVLQSYAETVDRPRHNALLACPSESVTRESAEHGHGTLTHHVLRALRGGAGDDAGRVSFAQMATFVAEQGMDPPPVHTAHVYGATTVFAQRPMSRHERQALSSPANPGTTRPCLNPLEDQTSSIRQLMDRMFRTDSRSARHPQQGEHDGRVELIRHALDAESAAVVEFAGSSFRPVNWTARFDKDALSPMLELAAVDAAKHPRATPGYVVSHGINRRMLCVPVSFEGGRTLALTVVDPALTQLDMGEPLAVMLRAVWESDPAADPIQSEMAVLTALRTSFGRLPLKLYEDAFSLYQQLIGSMIMVFQPVVELDKRPAGVSVHNFEALARRNDSELRAPWSALRMAHDWGDRFVVERDAILVAKALHSYAEADATSGWQGTKPLSVNVAVRSLLSDAYLGQVNKALAETGLHPRTLTLEISEQDPITPDPGERWPQEPLVYFHNRLTTLARELRISFAVDDFGVGYASLARMAELPLTQIKVDRAILHHPMALEELALVAGIARYATDQGHTGQPRTVIVEGFDDDAPVSLHEIFRLGIHHVQGYFSGSVASTTLRELEPSAQERIASLVRGEQ
ncbi:EAL domain-containing protein [Micromonospora sp. WMMA1923]|uniref:EAL domain-containing protein n=1 Tax=Micromonospora sp. WMMA1923 TaxID=3404125 RepID=UPI003B935929